MGGMVSCQGRFWLRGCHSSGLHYGQILLSERGMPVD